MAWQNNLREIRIILYRLKRSYGLPAVIKRVLTSTQDVKTGQIVRTFQTIPIKRVIVLPTRDLRNFIYDLTFVAANKNFTYGGLFDEKTRTMIIDIKDAPKGFVLTMNDHLVFETRRHEIKAFDLAEHNQGWLLQCIELDSSDAE
jgi:hypothetical protein